MDVKRIFKGKNAGYCLIGLIVILVSLFLLPRLIPARAGNVADSNATVTSVNVAEIVNASGSLAAQPLVALTWNTGGVVEEVYIQSGDQVKAGDVLMKLRTSSVDASIIASQATLVTAQKEMDDLLSAADTDLAQAVIDLRTAQQAYVRATNYLEFLERSKTTPQTQAKMFIESINRGGKRYEFKTKVMKDPAPEDWFIDARNDLALKKAQLADAQSTYDRFKNGADTQDLAAAQARIDSAQALVDSMTIIAPFNGQVLYVANKPGDVVNTSEVAVNMANLDHLYIEAQVDQASIVNISIGDPVIATLEAVDGLVLTGKVAAVDPLGTVEAGSVNYAVWMDIDSVSQDVFLPLAGTANVAIQVTEAEMSLAVPIAALQNDDQGEYVLVMQSADTSKRVDVISNTIIADLVVVTGDLQEGDTLMTAQNNALPVGGPFDGD